MENPEQPDSHIAQTKKLHEYDTNSLLPSIPIITPFLPSLTTAEHIFFFFFFQAEDGIRDKLVTGVQTCVFRSSAVSPSRSNSRRSRSTSGLPVVSSFSP